MTGHSVQHLSVLVAPPWCAPARPALVIAPELARRWGPALPLLVLEEPTPEQLGVLGVDHLPTWLLLTAQGTPPGKDGSRTATAEDSPEGREADRSQPTGDTPPGEEADRSVPDGTSGGGDWFPLAALQGAVRADSSGPFPADDDALLVRVTDRIVGAVPKHVVHERFGAP